MSGHPAQISDTFAGSGACVCLHTHTYDMQTLARTLNRMLSFLSDPHRAQCECQPVAILPSTPVHQFLPRGPQSYPRGLGPALPQSLFTQRKCQDQVWERQQFFCVQWTAGTFQIRAEFKVSTKAASMGFLFVSPCLLMSFSIRPKWFVSTSMHTIS